MLAAHRQACVPCTAQVVLFFAFCGRVAGALFGTYGSAPFASALGSENIEGLRQALLRSGEEAGPTALEQNATSTFCTSPPMTLDQSAPEVEITSNSWEVPTAQLWASALDLVLMKGRDQHRLNNPRALLPVVVSFSEHYSSRAPSLLGHRNSVTVPLASSVSSVLRGWM